MNNDLVRRIDFLLKQIDCAQSDIKDKTVEQFGESDRLVRATCFSLVQIGEQMAKMEEKLRDKYPNLPWNQARSLRNLIVHIYCKVDFAQIYDTTKRNLPELKESFLDIRSNLVNGSN